MSYAHPFLILGPAGVAASADIPHPGHASGTGDVTRNALLLLKLSTISWKSLIWSWPTETALRDPYLTNGESVTANSKAMQKNVRLRMRASQQFFGGVDPARIERILLKLLPMPSNLPLMEEYHLLS